MGVLAGVHALLVRLNSVLLGAGRGIGWVLMALMVVVILAQVFFRYVLNNALPWPEEAALALMIWMMGLMAPSAYRWGGFVAIDLVSELMPKWPRFLLVTTLMLAATLVTIVLLREAWTHYSSPILFNSSGLNRLLQNSGINDLLGTQIEFRAAYIYFGMVICFFSMLLVNIELVIRHIGQTFGNPEQFPQPPAPPALGGTVSTE